MNLPSFVSGLLLCAVALTGCAGSSDNEGSDSADFTAEADSSVVKAGTFRLFSSPNGPANPSCERYTELTIKGDGTAHLEDGVLGTCELLVVPNPRDYSLTGYEERCGLRVYEGSSRVAVDPVTTGLATIKIHDYRDTTCADGAAPIVVEETGFGAEGRELYGSDAR